MLTVNLRAIEKSIINTRRELRSPVEDPAQVICSVNNDVNEKTKVRLLRGSSSVLEEIGKIKEEYD